ncbi:Retrovirus-related Pol polyprotein from transposon 17.6 [Labeo rohita]|uniref:ribonuclease H n=1 Tax=Labeo rohita TaxID=84645 RepID=A0ABQ8L2A2_LABRO|nr:Retrovirus-related Pol polyprotein from transposon 17.6 [Labeo rohita]
MKYCRSCHTCQTVGKPNQSIPPAPLCPIPAIGEPFDRVILDCVGPLPRTKSGHKYILTMMCINTRFPEAVPLRTLKTKTILRALTKFFSTFGLPKVVQTNQARTSLASVQTKMKTWFDKKAVPRSFEQGDMVLVLLPILGSALQAKFSGPYVVDAKLSETDYRFCTPDRGRKTRVEKFRSSHRIKITPVIPESFREDIFRLIQSHPSLFSDVPSRTTVMYHDIDVRDHSPIKQYPYRVNPTKRQTIERSMRLRSLTLLRTLPRMEDCVDRVGSATFVTKLDLLKGYWQVPLTPRAAEISAFVTPDDLLQYTVMAFGLRTAPATFQRLMNKVLAGISHCDAYLDDIVIYSSEWDEHVKLLCAVFDRLCAASLTLNLAKCEFGKATVTYLGRQVGQGEVRLVLAKVQAIEQFPNKNYVWSDECQKAFVLIKTLLCSTPVLSAPNFSLPFKLDVVASATGAGAVLLQEDAHGIDHPVCYFSRKFLKPQLNYSTIEKEALALLLALQYFEVSPLICQLRCCLSAVIGCSAGGLFFKTPLPLSRRLLMRLRAGRAAPASSSAARPKTFFIVYT